MAIAVAIATAIARAAHDLNGDRAGGAFAGIQCANRCIKGSFAGEIRRRNANRSWRHGAGQCGECGVDLCAGFAQAQAQRIKLAGGIQRVEFSARVLSLALNFCGVVCQARLFSARRSDGGLQALTLTAPNRFLAREFCAGNVGCT